MATSSAAAGNDKCFCLCDGSGLEEVGESAVEVEGASEVNVRFADGDGVGDIA